MSRTSKMEFWQSNITDYRSSGLSADRWCQMNHLSVSTLRYWIAKLKRESSNQSFDVNPTFAKVELPKSSPFPLNSSAPVTIRCGSLEISISDHCHPDLLSNLLGILTAYA